MDTNPTLQANNWNHLPDIHATHAITDADQACLDEIREVLVRHGQLDRFGVSLLHKHFEMANDEILVESVDEASRKLVTKLVKVAAIQDVLPTAYETLWQWRLSGKGEPVQICIARCFPGNVQSPGHVNKHVGW